jgi:release factor glutamine methyltransferase
MTISESLKQATIPLVEKEILLADLLQKDRSFLFAHPEFELSKKQTREFLSRLQRRENNEPIAYILGYQEFWGRKFFVNKDVLIPRADTEMLVQEVLEFTGNKHLTVVDVGTGSGCIAITLACESPNLKIIATELSQEALVVAKKNALLHQVTNRITFIHSSLLAGIEKKLDVIVANLPYITTRNLRRLPEEIRDWEPQVALHSRGNSKRNLYEKMFAQTSGKLNPGGRVFYEVDGRIYHWVGGRSMGKGSGT